MSAAKNQPPPRCAILDRDGTLIDVVRDEETGTISVAFHPRHVRLLPGVLDGLQRLRDHHYALCIATNQPGPAKGQCSREAVERTNAALVERLAAHGIEIAAFEVCMEHPEGGPGGDLSLIGPSRRRKPQPGMLESALERTGVDAAHAWMIGDSEADVLAARAAGVRAALVFSSRRCEICPLRPLEAGGTPRLARKPDLFADRFDELIEQILEHDAA
jgi:D-glycero-D-manno-heptose 1,7-bisphosphate phosphatase